MYHYVYKIEDPVTKEFYFGSRTSVCLPIDDVFYKGSMKTWKPEDTSRLVKTILDESFANRDEANLYEYDIIKLCIKDTLNRNYSLPGPEFHTVGKDCSRGKNGFFGKTHSNETKKKQSHSGKDNPSYGKKWIHKDNVKKYVTKEEVESFIDEGWTLGYLMKNNPFKIKRIWITDGKNNKYIKESELVIPDGWRLGKAYSETGLAKIKEASKNMPPENRKKAVEKSKMSIQDTVWLHNEDGNYRAKKHEVDLLLENGYKKGRKDYKPWNKK